MHLLDHLLQSLVLLVFLHYICLQARQLSTVVVHLAFLRELDVYTLLEVGLVLQDGLAGLLVRLSILVKVSG